MLNELYSSQRAFRYAAVNDLYPGLITAHVIDNPRKDSIELTAYINIDGQTMRIDDEIYYSDLEQVGDLTLHIVDKIDKHVKKYKEKK